jgi:mevalonate kinase
LRELAKTKDKHKASLLLHDRIFDAHYSQIDQLIQQAESALDQENLNPDEVIELINEIDQHLHEVNHLTQDL